MLMTFSILGIIGGLLCAVADMLWDFKGADNNSVFIREQTLAGGGEYCDCHYIHTPKK